jgi:hypothetical protein
MKTYEILVDGRRANDYIKGRISGIVDALTGMPEVRYCWKSVNDGIEWTLNFDATEEQRRSVMEALNKCHFDAFVGIREIG